MAVPVARLTRSLRCATCSGEIGCGVRTTAAHATGVSRRGPSVTPANRAPGMLLKLLDKVFWMLFSKVLWIIGSAQESGGGVHFRRLSRKRPLQPFVKAEYSISKKMGGIRCFAVEMARRGRSGGTTNLRCLVRPRRLETRTERGFPHFHSNGGYCSLAHLKRQTRQNRGVRQILAQNRVITLRTVAVRWMPRITSRASDISRGTSALLALPVASGRCPTSQKTVVAPTVIAVKLARNRRKAPPASPGRWRASRMPHDVNGGTNAVAIATPTITPVRPTDM